MDEHVEVPSGLGLDLTFHLFHLLFHLFNSSSSLAALTSVANFMGSITWLGWGCRFWLAKLPSSFWSWFWFPSSSFQGVSLPFWPGLGIWTSPRGRRRAISSWFCRVSSCISYRSAALCRANSWMLAVRTCIYLSEAFKCWSLVSPASMGREDSYVDRS